MASAEISREVLIGYWKVVAPVNAYLELREDGTARRKITGRGTSCDVDLPIHWKYIEPAGLELVYQRPEEAAPRLVNEYRLKYFNGKDLEWWHVRMNDNVVENVILTTPESWKRTRPPKSWESV